MDPKVGIMTLILTLSRVLVAEHWVAVSVPHFLLYLYWIFEHKNGTLQAWIKTKLETFV